MDGKYNKTTIIFLHDALVVLAAWILAYLLRFGFVVSQTILIQALRDLYILLPIQLFFNYYFGLYRGVWRFASIPDLVRILKAVAVGSIATLVALFLLTRLTSIPRTIFPIYVIVLTGLLIAPRLYYRCFKDRKSMRNKSKRVLVLGAGDAGGIWVRNLLYSGDHDYKVIAFIDDAKSKQGKEIHGIRVIGTCADISNIVKHKQIELVIIAIPSATAEQMRNIVNICSAAKVQYKTLPSLNELITGNANINTLRDVALEDLLGRDEVNIDSDDVKKTIANKVVLVSGGGGSIGSAICLKVATLKPKVLAIIDNSEVNVFHITRELTAKFPKLKFMPFLGSITDQILVKRILDDIKPEIVFHAAAYKHVPILESQVYSAVHNNVIGTKILADLASVAKVKKFILISTDKAVNPANIMGTTKRIAELICHNKNHIDDPKSTKFTIVRFGNVLGSSGSVVPIFKQQVAAGGPVTVTHPDITRYFMTIPEAAHLILQACALGTGGETFVLDMGKPMSIRYLAEQVIRLLGKEPETEIQIHYSGLRPGEKLHEELFYQHEKVINTKHHKIFQAKIDEISHNIEEKIEHIITALLYQGTEQELVELLTSFKLNLFSL